MSGGSLSNCDPLISWTNIDHVNVLFLTVWCSCKLLF